MIRRSFLLAALFAVSASSLAPSTSRRAFFRTTAVATTASVFAAASPPASASTTTPPTGAKAPQFELPNSRGEGMTSLTDLTKNNKWSKYCDHSKLSPLDETCR